MKRSNVWRSPHGDLWEARNGGVDFGLDDGSAFRLYADGCAQYREEFYTPSPNDSLVEAWEVLIGDPLPALRKFSAAIPDTYRAADGEVWARSEGGVRVPLGNVWFVTESGHIVSDGLRRDNRPDWIQTCARVREAWAALYPKSSRSEPPKKRPRKFRDSDGDVWIRGFKRGRVLFRRYDGSLFEAYVKKGKVNYTDNRSPTPYQDDECADQVRAAIAALWPEKGSK